MFLVSFLFLVFLMFIFSFGSFSMVDGIFFSLCGANGSLSCVSLSGSIRLLSFVFLLLLLLLKYHHHPTCVFLVLERRGPPVLLLLFCVFLDSRARLIVLLQHPRCCYWIVGLHRLGPLRPDGIDDCDYWGDGSRRHDAFESHWLQRLRGDPVCRHPTRWQPFRWVGPDRHFLYQKHVKRQTP